VEPVEHRVEREDAQWTPRGLAYPVVGGGWATPLIIGRLLLGIGAIGNFRGGPGGNAAIPQRCDSPLSQSRPWPIDAQGSRYYLDRQIYGLQTLLVSDCGLALHHQSPCAYPVTGIEMAVVATSVRNGTSVTRVRDQLVADRETTLSDGSRGFGRPRGHRSPSLSSIPLCRNNERTRRQPTAIQQDRASSRESRGALSRWCQRRFVEGAKKRSMYNFEWAGPKPALPLHPRRRDDARRNRVVHYSCHYGSDRATMPTY